MDHMNMDHGHEELDHLFERYRAALPDPEASVNFMPELWRKIEARQFFLARREEADSGIRRCRRRNLPVFGDRSPSAGFNRHTARPRQLC